ncbi:nucleotidyltransferase [Paenibacillus anaericanus]|uniref:tRNA(Met) cytidine acetate ligase n=1 Tax=Paenibacillus anaericanus TaxID=170367 RepID=A0A3S1BQ49_9BACL|nr:nucleotidyltransferase [Paenibacillus anaericanus]RUT46944.1 nucleotidyltransferase [Paenibacillus anaericanus]
MNITGLIVEYNPLHNGHAYHFAEAKRLTNADGVIAVMSGDFLQRGEPALVNKWARAEMALHLGVDLVLELPVAYATQPAEWFAYGAVALLEATGIVTDLCFGSEAGQLEALLPLAEQLADESDALRAALAEQLATGASYPAAYAAAAAATLTAAGGDTSSEAIVALLAQPNNSLGLQYLIALRRLRSRISPVTVLRNSSNYGDVLPGNATIASATAVRRLIESDGLAAIAPYVPHFTADILAREFAAGRGPVTWESFTRPLFHRLLLSSPQELAGHHEMTEGLQFRIKKTLYELEKPTVSALLQQLKTKRYTLTKLQRTLLHVLLQNERSELSRSALAEGPGYLRVLGFSAKGRKLLKTMRKSASLPIVTRAADLTHPHLELDLKASSVYANAMQERDQDSIFRDYRQPPIML